MSNAIAMSKQRNAVLEQPAVTAMQKRNLFDWGLRPYAAAGKYYDNFMLLSLFRGEGGSRVLTKFLILVLREAAFDPICKNCSTNSLSPAVTASVPTSTLSAGFSKVGLSVLVCPWKALPPALVILPACWAIPAL